MEVYNLTNISVKEKKTKLAEQIIKIKVKINEIGKKIQ